MIQNLSQRLTSVLSDMQTQIENKLNSIGSIGIQSGSVSSTGVERLNVPLAPIFSRNSTNPSIPVVLEPDEVSHLSQIELDFIEELRKSWPTFTRTGPSGQMTLHAVQNPIKFPSQYQFPILHIWPSRFKIIISALQSRLSTGDYKVAELLRTWHLGDESRGLPPLKLLDRNLDFDWKTTRVKKDGSTVEVEDKANYSKAKLVSWSS